MKHKGFRLKDRIRTAPSKGEIEQLLVLGGHLQRATSRTVNRWRIAAATRSRELRTA